MTSPVRLEHDGPLAIVTLDSPPLNLFDAAMMEGLDTAVRAVADSDARAMLLRAEGRAVSAGVDVHVFATLDEAAGAEVWRRWFGTVHRIEDLPIPTVFAAHGLCLTAAFEISLACDLLLAAESAKFGLVEKVVALTPSMGGPQRLAERAGPARARELVYSAELFSATTLELWNVVNRVLPADGFDVATRSFAMSLAVGPTKAHGATKAIVRAQLDSGTRGADAATPEISGALFGTEDLKNAVASFLQDGPGKATYEGR